MAGDSSLHSKTLDQFLYNKDKTQLLVIFDRTLLPSAHASLMLEHAPVMTRNIEESVAVELHIWLYCVAAKL